jgi:hypothetical protein
MRLRGDNGQSTRAYGSIGRLRFGLPREAGPAPQTHAPDTLHCSSDVAGSAVQFNGSVSPMPAHPARTFAAPPHPGTVDTLLLC